MKSIVLGLAGKIASGKSTLAISFAEVMEWPCVSFGNYVRAVARERGLDDSQREVLQQIGALLIDENYEGFCRAVVAQAEQWRPGKPLVIDGIRHLQVKQALERIVAPSSFVLGYIAVNDQIRRERLLKERPTVKESLEQVELSSTEVQVKSELFNAADFTLDGTKPISMLIEELKTKLFDKLEAV